MSLYNGPTSVLGPGNELFSSITSINVTYATEHENIKCLIFITVT